MPNSTPTALRQIFHALLFGFLWLSAPLSADDNEDFRCVVCRQVVSNGYLVEGKFYCQADLDEALPKCRNCKKTLRGNYVAVSEQNYPVCFPCRELPRCFLCTMPSTPSNGGKRLEDGREVCPEHVGSGVVDEKQAGTVYRQAVSEILGVFGTRLRLKQPIAAVKLVNLDELKTSAQNGGHSSELKSGRVLGLAIITWRLDGRAKTMQPATICLLSHVPVERMLAVAAHEYTHVWHAENNPNFNKSSRVFREGFAEWVTFKVAESLSRQTQTQIMKNPNGGDYYSGLTKFLELERRRGVQGVLDYAVTATNI